jgi:hypothetical protein
VPANQARDVEIPIHEGSARDLSAVKILGTANILLTPTETRAQAAGGAKPID